MYGAYAASNPAVVQPNQAIEVSEHIITQLTSHTHDDPKRPSHRKFLEEYGTDRMDQLEAVLTNFITAADTLTIDGIPYIGSTRTMVAFILFTCKDIVEGNAAKLKGWGKYLYLVCSLLDVPIYHGEYHAALIPFITMYLLRPCEKRNGDLSIALELYIKSIADTCCYQVVSTTVSTFK